MPPHVAGQLRRIFLMCALLPIAVAMPACSRDQRDTPEAHLAKGTEAIAAFDWDRAYKEFSLTRKAVPPKSDIWLKATFGLANAAHHRMPASAATISEAKRLYEEILATDSTSPMAARTMLNLGRIAELPDFLSDPVNLDEARSWYTKVQTQFPNDPIVGEARLRLAASYIGTFDPAQARQGVSIIEKHLADKPDEPLASAMYQYLGDVYFYPLNDYRKSLEAYKQCERLGWTQKGRQGGIYWRMAVMAERLDPPDHDAAITFYTKIIKDTPTSGKAYESQLALKRLGAPVPPIELFPGASALTAEKAP